MRMRKTMRSKLGNLSGCRTSSANSSLVASARRRLSGEKYPSRVTVTSRRLGGAVDKTYTAPDQSGDSTREISCMYEKNERVSSRTQDARLSADHRSAREGQQGLTSTDHSSTRLGPRRNESWRG